MAKFAEPPADPPSAAQEPPAAGSGTPRAPQAQTAAHGILGRALLVRKGVHNSLFLRNDLRNEKRGYWTRLPGSRFTRSEIEDAYAEVREVLVVDPAVAQVLAAARAWRATVGEYAELHEERTLAAAVDAAEGRGHVVADDDLPEWERELLERQDAEHDRRREWAAALSWAAAEFHDFDGTRTFTDHPGARKLAWYADRIESGALTPWADQPDEAAPEPARCDMQVERSGASWPCDQTLPCSEHPHVTAADVEPAPEPDSGPEWDQVPGAVRAAWLAELERERARWGHYKRLYLSGLESAQRLRAELAEVTADRDQWQRRAETAERDWGTLAKRCTALETELAGQRDAPGSPEPTSAEEGDGDE